MPRLIERPGLPPAFIIEEEDIDTVWLPSFPEGSDLPFSVLIDSQGHCHIEYNHAVFDPAKEPHRRLKKLLWLFRPDLYFKRIAPGCIEGSLLRYERALIGGMNCHYYTGKREVYLQYWGILSKEQLIEEGLDPECRQGIGLHHCQVIDHFGKRLGARRGVAASSTPAVWGPAEACGWYRQRPTLRQRWDLFTGTFPVSLWKRDVPLLKIYDNP